MGLIVEDGTGLSNSESYASVAEADAYHAARGNTDWDAVDDKEAALRKATEHMLQTYTLRWSGYRAKSTQALDWPRSQAERKNVLMGSAVEGIVYYESTVVPMEVKRACMELAVRAASAALTADLDREVASESVSGAVSVTYVQGSRRQVKYAVVDMILEPLLARGSSGLGVVRA